MKKVKDSKSMLIFVLLAITLIMVVGFAAFNTALQINGTANISTNWCVGFDNTKTNTYQITKGNSAGTNPTATMGYSGTACSSTYVPIANLGAVFYQPGDKVEYTLTIANKGSIEAAIESITVDNTSVTSDQTITKGNIIWKVYMPASTTLAASTGTTTMVVSAEFQNTTDLTSYTSQETQTITVGINAVQSTGSNAMVTTQPIQKVYAINTNTITEDSSTLANIGTTYNSCAATGKNVCLRYTIDRTDNNKVTGSEVCFVYNSTEYCLTGADSEEAYSTNKTTLLSAFGSGCSGDIAFNYDNDEIIEERYKDDKIYIVKNKIFLASPTEPGQPSTGQVFCSSGSCSANANSRGYVGANDDSWNCHVNDYGESNCNNSGGSN